MSQENVGLIRSLYEAFGRGDVPPVLAAMDPAIVEGVFARLGGEWDGFSVTLEELLDARVQEDVPGSTRSSPTCGSCAAGRS